MNQYSDEDLNAAVKEGIFSQEAVNRFRDYINQESGTTMVDEEHFRLVTGFNDIFVVIACLLLLLSINWIGDSIFAWMGPVLQVGAAWGLAEYFTRVRRMALPSIVLMLSFVGGLVSVVAEFASGHDFSLEGLLAIQGIVAAIGASAHWFRFKVPITIAAGVATLVAAIIALIVANVPGSREWLLAMIFASGIVVFGLAMFWDWTDKARITRRSDVAFWLHLLAAPLLVHPIFNGLDVFHATIGLGTVLMVGALYLLIALVSITIDRRALMVSSLIYVIYAISALFKTYGVVNLNFSITAFSIGAGLLLLSAFWHRCRQGVFYFYPESIKQLVPPLK